MYVMQSDAGWRIGERGFSCCRCILCAGVGDVDI